MDDDEKNVRPKRENRNGKKKSNNNGSHYYVCTSIKCNAFACSVMQQLTKQPIYIYVYICTRIPKYVQ